MRQVTFSTLFSFLIVLVMCDASAQTGDALPNVETIIARMAEARAGNQACFRPYVVTRDYRLFGKDRARTKARVLADITFTPPDAKKYAIQQATGSGLGKRIVRRALAGEVDIAKVVEYRIAKPDVALCPARGSEIHTARISSAPIQPSATHR